ncbi:unnamed protein product [Calypogeia fissa]
MGWFLPSHIDQGVIFGCLGAWHIYSILRLYITNPDKFRCRAWFPNPGQGAWRCAELWTLLFIVVFFIFKQMSHATEDLAKGVILSEHLMRFQHVSFALFFLLYICVALVNEMTSLLPLPQGVLTGTFGLGFLAELMVFHFGHHPGDNLESYVHLLIQLILAGLVTMMFMEIAYPRSILVGLSRAMLLTFKGTWFFQIGLLINAPSFMPTGCTLPDNGDFPICPQPMDNMRAKAIQVLVLVVQAVGIVAFTFSLYAVMLATSTFRLSSKLPFTPEIKPLLTDSHHSVFYVVDKDSEFGDAVEEARIPITKDLGKSLSRRISNKTDSPLPQLQIPKVLI